MRLVKAGQTVDVDDSNQRLIDYYTGEGFTADSVAPAAEVVSFPRVFDGERYVDEPAAPQQVEQLPDGEFATEADGPVVDSLLTGKHAEPVEHPADGSQSPEVSNP